MDFNNIQVTEEEKQKGLDKAGETILAYIKGNEKFTATLRRLLRIGITILCIVAGIGLWLVFKPKSATQTDLNYIKSENENLENRRKLLQYDIDAFRQEKALFVIYKTRIDSLDNVKTQQNIKLMANIYKQDSISKLKQVIKTDHINTKSIGTVNAQTVIKK